jgi:hypothetical protein
MRSCLDQIVGPSVDHVAFGVDHQAEVLMLINGSTASALDVAATDLHTRAIAF